MKHGLRFATGAALMCVACGPAAPDSPPPVHAEMGSALSWVAWVPAVALQDTVDVYEGAEAPVDLRPLEDSASDLTGDTGAGVGSRLPVVRGLPGDHGYEPIVYCDEPEAVERIELRASFGTFLSREA